MPWSRVSGTNGFRNGVSSRPTWRTGQPRRACSEVPRGIGLNVVDEVAALLQLHGDGPADSRQRIEAGQPLRAAGEHAGHDVPRGSSDDHAAHARSDTVRPTQTLDIGDRPALDGRWRRIEWQRLVGTALRRCAAGRDSYRSYRGPSAFCADAHSEGSGRDIDFRQTQPRLR